jgi:hypothetical protein
MAYNPEITVRLLCGMNRNRKNLPTGYYKCTIYSRWRGPRDPEGPYLTIKAQHGMSITVSPEITILRRDRDNLTAELEKIRRSWNDLDAIETNRKKEGAV